jgi:hypothetical protein
MSIQSPSGFALGLVLLGLVGCVDEPAGEQAGSGSASASAISDAGVDTTATETQDATFLPDTTSSQEQCEEIPLELPGPDYDAGLVSIESADVRAWLGADEIPVRSRSFAPDVPFLPRIGFKTFDDQQVAARLVDTCGAVFELSGTMNVEETDNAFRLEGVEWMAYCRKGTGLCSCSRKEPSQGAVVTNSLQAVNVALGWLLEIGLDLPEHVTLDVTGVTMELPAEAYGVSFGFRYDGVPLLREHAASVNLAPNGGLKSYYEHAPRIAGEIGEPIELIDEAELQDRRKDEYACYPMISAECGYLVGTGTEAGVGCVVDYDNLDSGDPMTNIVGEEIRLASDEP